MQHASAIAVSTPLKIAAFLRGRGDEATTLDDIADNIDRPLIDVERHLPEAREIVRRERYLAA